MNDIKNPVNNKVGVYIRLSRDENQENIETIETQRDMLIDYVEKNRLGAIYKLYIDDNVSGSTFDRKGIQELRDDITSYKVNILVVKDLSRLGRNNAKTLLFLDFLEEYRVRVVASDGRYDSEKDSDIVGIETWFNERYVRDISRKIRSTLRFKIEKGEYIGSAPYGYVKSIEEKNRLCIDINTSNVVREIFELYKKGYGYAYIADILEERGYIPPSGRMSVSWNAVTVKRILCNRVYTGDTVQGVSEKVSFKSKKTRRLPQSDWVVTENTHQPIIGREEFEDIQKIRLDKQKFSGSHKGGIHLLRGLIYCGKCGSVMFARTRKQRPLGYICSNYCKKGRIACESHYIREEVITDILSGELMELLSDLDLIEKTDAFLKKSILNKDNIQTELKNIKQQLSTKHRQQEVLYIDRLEGRVSEQLFERLNDRMENDICILARRIDEIKEKYNTYISVNDIISNIIGDIQKNNITHDVIKLLVDKISVFNAGDGLGHNGAVVIDFSYNKV